MNIKGLKVKNLDLINDLVTKEHENRGMINGRDIMISDARIVFEFSASLPELSAIKNISSEISFSFFRDQNDHLTTDSCVESLGAYTDDATYIEYVKQMVLKTYLNADEPEYALEKSAPIGAIEFNGSATFIGSAIRALTSTGSYSELCQSFNDDEVDLGELLPRLFFQAVYKDMMLSLSYDYSPLNRYLYDKRYLAYTENHPFTVLNIYTVNGEIDVPFIDVTPDELDKLSKDFFIERGELAKKYYPRVPDSYARVNCYTTIDFFYMLKLSDNVEIIDAEPMSEFLQRKHRVYNSDVMDSEVIKQFQKIDCKDKTNFVVMMGMMPMSVFYHYTIQFKVSSDGGFLLNDMRKDDHFINSFYVRELERIHESLCKFME